MILDIHTHRLSPDPRAIIDISDLLRERDIDQIIRDYPSTDQSQMADAPDGVPASGQLFSVGIHPWQLLHEEPSEELLTRIRHAARHPCVAIIGEAGIDIPKGGPLFRQMIIFKQMAQLAEEVGKPLLIHDVKAHDIILGLHKEMNPVSPWILHGFRGKPSVADMFLRRSGSAASGFFFSFGENFNPLTLHNLPADRILAETDTSPLPISEIIHLLSDARGLSLSHTIAENTAGLISNY